MSIIEQLEHRKKLLKLMNSPSSSEVYTPVALVEEMLDKLPKEIWKDPKLVWCDPCAKSGVFILEVIIRLMKNLNIGDETFTHDHIINNNIKAFVNVERNKWVVAWAIYGSVKEVDRIKLLEINKIKEEDKMKWDVVVGNPPYHESSKSDMHIRKQSGQMKLWVKFLKLGKNVLNNNGYLLYVTPNNWLYETNKLKVFFKKYLKYANISDYISTKYFPSISNVFFSYYILDNNINQEHIIEIDNVKHYNLLNFKLFPKKKITNIKINIFKKIITNDKNIYFKWVRSDVKGAKQSKYKNNIYKYPIIGARDGLNTDLYTTDALLNKAVLYRSTSIPPEFDNKKMPSGHAYISFFDNKEHAKNVVQILNLKLYRFIVFNIRSGMALVSDVNYIPFPKNIGKKWSDQELYEYFNLTREEIDYIEAQVK